MRRVLLIDDDQEFRRGLKRLLHQSAVEVIEASSGVDALSLLRDNAIDAVVMDVFMEQRDGLETLRELKKEVPEVPVIMMSGGSERCPAYDPLRVASCLGAEVVLYKPFALNELLDGLDSINGLNEFSVVH